MANGLSVSDIGWLSIIAQSFLLAGWVVRTWPLWKAKLNEARKIQLDADGEQYKRVLEWCDRLDARVAVLEEEVETCRRERDEAKAEVMRWKAIAEGVGANRQEGAVRSAMQRRKDKNDAQE